MVAAVVFVLEMTTRLPRGCLPVIFLDTREEMQLIPYVGRARAMFKTLFAGYTEYVSRVRVRVMARLLSPWSEVAEPRR